MEIKFHGLTYSLLVVLLGLSEFAFSVNTHIQISIIQFVATPEKYDGKKVAVRGWFNGSRLWLTREQEEYGDHTSAIEIIGQENSEDLFDNCEGKYVTVLGTVSEESKTYWIEGIEWVYHMKGRGFCWKQAGDNNL